MKTATATSHPNFLPSEWVTDQSWERYSAAQHQTWEMLWDRRMEMLSSTASERILQGIENIGLERTKIPSLDSINARLKPVTGWSAFAVTGFIPARQFFDCLAVRRFPTTVTIRPQDQLDYLPEPDIFHDVFGHVPLHSDPVFANFLAGFGSLAAHAASGEQTEWLTRLFWFTVEFGLIEESGTTRVYGSGLVSSAGDAANALSERCDRRRFDLNEVIAQPFEIDHFQDVLFVIDDFAQLFEAVEELRDRLG